MSEPAVAPIPSTELGGAIAVNVFALLSAIALASVICRVSWMAIQRCSKPDEIRECVFFNTQLGHYAACLIIALVFNAIAGILGLRWTVEHGITEGKYKANLCYALIYDRICFIIDWICNAQATLMQLGNFATGFFTIAIAIHTFNSLVLKMRQSVIICRTTMAIGWTLSLLILLASVLGAILYSLIFLILRGTLKFKQGIKLTLDPQERWNDFNSQGENYQRFIARVARSMLWYPVAYVALLIPYAVTRLFVISGFTVPFEANVFAFVCYISLSFVDVLLLYNTFRVLGPAFDARSSASTTTKKMIESFGTPGTLEKYDPTSTDLEEKIQHYRGQSFGSMSMRPGSENSFATSSGKSMQPLLPLYLGRNDGQLSPSMIGRSITYSSTYSQWEIQTPARIPTAVRAPRQDIAAHIRNDSFSSRGLPAPPRNRSPVEKQPLPDLQLSEQPNDPVYTDQWLSRQRSTQTFGHAESPPAKSPSLFSEEASGSEWSRRGHHRQASQPYTSAYGQPSVVAPSFSQPYPKVPQRSAKIERSNSVSVSPTSPSDRLRPLLLSRGSTPDMRASSRASSSHYSDN
ncbi:hypothetical protein CPB84DRAFT_1844044 [Gymnopilus junonius]|uniref:Uncharacterized protein n=1 Tax=Gymnopilus junonius TaxID=109634 RepID=A0A9P5NX19_GYMJU|nr:hypothetical protein CPB84DRAFT_1844044 [Gymnopilus junonius]